MKNIRCLIGKHDWQSATTSEEWGYYGPDRIPVRIADLSECRKTYVERATDDVCLRCGDCRWGIEKCQTEWEDLQVEKAERQREQARRTELAQDIIKMCNKKN